jgi:hypothetical protein
MESETYPSPPVRQVLGRTQSLIGEAVTRIRTGVDRRWLGALLLLDLGFIALHLLYRATHPMWDLTRDLGYPEHFQYLKELCITLLLAWAGLRFRDRWLWLWSALFAYLLLDDRLLLHERSGSWIASQLELGGWFGPHAVHVGELAYMAFLGLTALCAAGLMLARGRRPGARNIDLALLFGVLVFFGAGVDFVHAYGDSRGWRGLGLLEDGGEMLAMSLIAAYVAPLPRAAALSEKASR